MANDYRRRRIFFLILVVLYALFALQIALVSVPFNPVSYLASVKSLRILVPEGWGFFTREPKEERIYLYKITEEGQLNLILPNYLSLKNFFGASRNRRMFNIELSRLTQQLEDSMWTYCEKGLKNISLDRLKTHIVVNTVQHPQMEGTYLLLRRRPIPWAWSNARGLHIPANTLKIEVIKVGYVPHF